MHDTYLLTYLLRKRVSESDVTYIASDDDIVNILLFTVKSHDRDHAIFVVPQWYQLERRGGLLVQSAADAGIGGAVTVGDGYVGDEDASFDVLWNRRQCTVAVEPGGLQHKRTRRLSRI